MKTCPNCGMPIDDGANFCGECGCELVVSAETPAVTSVTEAPATSSVSEAPATSSVPKAGLPKLPVIPDQPAELKAPSLSPVSMPEISKVPVMQGQPMEPAAPTFSQPFSPPPSPTMSGLPGVVVPSFVAGVMPSAPQPQETASGKKTLEWVPFTLSYCAPERFRVDLCSALRFYFQTKFDDFVSVELVLRNGERELGRGKLEIVPGSGQGEGKINLTPQLAGIIPVDVWLICERTGSETPETYRAELKVTVDEKESGGGNTIIVQGNNSGIMDFRNAAAGGTVQNKVDPRLYACDESNRHPLTPKLRQSAARLSLVSSCETIHLLSDSEIVFGKSRSATVFLCAYSPETGEWSKFLTDHISGKHFRILVRDGRVNVCDGVEGKPSTNGIRLSEKKFNSGESRQLAINARYSLDVLQNPVTVLLPLQIRTYGDKRGHTSFGCVVERKDGFSCRIFALWQNGVIPFSDKGQDGIGISWNGSCFRLSDQDGQHTLAIGRQVEIHGTSYRVEAYNKLPPKKISPKADKDNP
ncbi:MAG: zinc-ribbon domain-containing protein [Kiritimatiellae bacterium]|nr:zinc-ribbon domain-containing protein [Kiritimatiellia bacterium]